jgi:hypothetical protein
MPSIMTGVELSHAEVGVREFVVKDLVPKGSLTLVAARKGRGKSVFTLSLAHHVTTGRPFLGRPVTQGQWLYVGTEDDSIELKGRYKRLCDTLGDDASPDIDLGTQWAKQSEGGIDELRRWVAGCDNPQGITIDLAVGVTPELLVVRRGWAAIATLMKEWIDLARQENIAIILVLHMNRGKDNSSDPIGDVQGSGAVTAYAQTLLVIQGSNLGSERSLFVAGKFGNGMTPITIDGASMTVELRDTSSVDDEAMSKERSRLITLIAQNPGLKARELARKCRDRQVEATCRLLQMMGDDHQVDVRERRYYPHIVDVTELDNDPQLSLLDAPTPRLVVEEHEKGVA